MNIKEEFIRELSALSDGELEYLISRVKDRKAQLEPKLKLLGTYPEVTDFPEEVLDELRVVFGDEISDNSDWDEMDILSDYVSDYMNSTQIGSNSDYLLYSGSFNTANFKIQRDYSRYIKDGGICNAEYDAYEIYKLN